MATAKVKTEVSLPEGDDGEYKESEVANAPHFHGI
jgi:hypothetical protein